MLLILKIFIFHPCPDLVVQLLGTPLHQDGHRILEERPNRASNQDRDEDTEELFIKRVFSFIEITQNMYGVVINK